MNTSQHNPEEQQEERTNRPIRSFVLRQGRMSDGQKRAVDTYMPQYGLAYEPKLIDAQAIFGRNAPLIVEIGFGMGTSTAEIARTMPDHDFIGIEVHSPGVGNLCKLIAEQQLSNLRIIQHDAVEVFQHMIASQSLQGLHVFFPDPWPKKRHHKRRLLQPERVSLFASRLKPGGYIHCATDWAEYAEQMLEVLNAEPALRNTHAGFAPKPAYRPLTKFEARGIGLGHGVWDLVFVRG